MRKYASQLDFNHLDVGKRNKWWDIPLTDFKTYGQQCKRMIADLKVL
jgi:hypothetical protein